MDLKLIKNILNLISESDVDEVSLEEGDFKIRVKKTATIEQVSYTQPAAPQVPQAAPAQPNASNEAGADTTESVQSTGPNIDGETIKSPIVGTYYEAPSPESDNFIKEGDKVKAGQTLCIVEAMKIMNEIEAEFSGTVQKILVKNAQPVEYDQPLFIIKKD
ncbi:MAG: acetyl-CoA carboxylase biotin carboxyl carrier protein [Balneolaceae bacterium]